MDERTLFRAYSVPYRGASAGFRGYQMRVRSIREPLLGYNAVAGMSGQSNRIPPPAMLSAHPWDVVGASILEDETR
jgi:hypothetical protein